MAGLKSNVIVPVFFWIFLLLSSDGAVAQNKWKASFRPGIDFSTENLGDAHLSIGYGFETTISYRFHPHISVFAGWSFNSFSARQSFAGTNGEFDESGYSFGFRFIYPTGVSRFNYVIGAGGTYHHIEVENYKRQTIANSGYGFGWQLEAGFSYTIIKNLEIMPTIRYRSLSREIPMENTVLPVHLNYISVGAGMILSF